ncbi:hypothetical protein [Microvirga yunnanensis]|uniref:hypothetical protein n=1 Tax=Microvirga yunnanensis TaxID=2953740 RepID=UPI0021CA8E1D|nr:hypothetical protein [Microvirga sp. HBU65207]
MASTFFPYKSSDDVGLSLTFKGAAPVETGDLFDLSRVRPSKPFSIEISVLLSGKALQKVLHASELSDPPVEVVVRVSSLTSRRRFVVPAPKSGHSYRCTLSIRPDDWTGDITIDAAAVRKSGASNLPVGFAADKGAQVMYVSAPKTIRLDSAGEVSGSGLDVLWEDFSDPNSGLSAYKGQLFALDDTNDLPRVRLNSSLAPQVVQVLNLEGPGSPNAPLRDMAHSLIAHSVIAALLSRTLLQVRKDASLDQLQDWQQKLFRDAASHLFLDDSPSDPVAHLLSEISDDESFGQVLVFRVPLAAQSMSKLGISTRRALIEAANNA